MCFIAILNIHEMNDLDYLRLDTTSTSSLARPHYVEISLVLELEIFTFISYFSPSFQVLI